LIPHCPGDVGAKVVRRLFQPTKQGEKTRGDSGGECSRSEIVEICDASGRLDGESFDLSVVDPGIGVTSFIVRGDCDGR